MLLFFAEPKPYYSANQHSTITKAKFVEFAVKELPEGGCIEKVYRQPHICSPISVVASGRGKKRLVIKLKHVSRLLLKQF